MTIYCDESGGLSAGAMTFAAVAIGEAQAHALLDRFKDVTGLRGELKGSRIGLTERALFYEYLERFGGRACIAVVRQSKIASGPERPQDINVYARLLETILDHLRTDMPTRQTVIIDDGRYDAAHQQGVVAEVQKHIGDWATIKVADSRRSAGVQIADVLANTLYNLAIKSARADRIKTIVKPFIAERIIRVTEIERI